MGKRTKTKTEDEIRAKIKRLEKELVSRQNVTDTRHSSSPEDIDIESYYGYGSEELEEYAADEVNSASGACPEPEAAPASTLEPLVVTDDATGPDQQGKSAIIEQELAQEEAGSSKVPEEILALLGEAKSSEETLGDRIPREIAERWEKIIIDGLAKEQKESLLGRTLFPENFQLAKAPKLNAEVSAILTESTKNRDKRFEKMQNQLGAGIAGIANLTAELIANDLNKLNIIKQLSEVNQILLDLHHEETMARRRLIIPLLDKSFINIIHGVKRDKYLFGENLGENIRTTKTIEKSSLQIKKPAPPQSAAYRRATASTSQGNSRVPPRQASGPGSARVAQSYARHYPQPPPPPAARRGPPQPPRRPAAFPPPPPPQRPQDRRGRR